jgi:hypothetical protein
MPHYPQLYRVNRTHGALLGLDVGDMIRTTVEFSPRSSFAPLTDILSSGTSGQLTLDTKMSLNFSAIKSASPSVRMWLQNLTMAYQIGQLAELAIQKLWS